MLVNLLSSCGKVKGFGLVMGSLVVLEISLGLWALWKMGRRSDREKIVAWGANFFFHRDGY